VADDDAVRSMVEQIVRDHGRLDVAVNNAGIGGDQVPTGEYPVESWRKVLSVNLDGVFYCMRHELPAMVAGGGGSIVNMASILGSVGFAQSCAYVSAKHGVVGLTRTAALEYAKQSIRVNAVGPGFIETPLLAAALVAFLASDEASFVTGSYSTVDGGYTAQ
jgi:NAD(P)-dependent dehydrogenase (short-subunit alcohol dehydrogenase family)